MSSERFGDPERRVLAWLHALCGGEADVIVRRREAGAGKAERAHALIVHLEQRGRVADLVAFGQRTRPDVP